MSRATAADPRRREWVLVAVLTALPLLPFLNAAVSIDAPVFLAVARQILSAPADPFGFEMIWDPTSPHVHQFNRNPPLLSYYLALWIRAFGEWEPALHAALLPFPLLASLSFFGIARRTAGDGLAPAAMLVVTPAFLVLATTLMLDVPVVAFMLFAVYAMLRGNESEGSGWQWAAGAAAAAAGLTKYVGLSIAPLLGAAVVWLYPRRGGPAARMVGLPLAVWALWGAATASLYGTPHFWGATDLLADKSFDPDEFWNQVLSTPVFYGGALVFPIFAWVRGLLGRTPGTELAVLGLLLGTAAVTFALPEGEPPRRNPIEVDEAVLGAVGFAGAAFVWIRCLRPKRFLEDAVGRFLVLWLGGFLAFSLFVNWHVNAADALLAGPPALLLLFRDPRLRPSRRVVSLWVALLLPLSFLLAWADADQAGVYRDAERRIAAEIGERGGEGWFVGHWGLQYYLERRGFRAVVPPQYERQYGKSVLEKGDWVVSARNVSQLDVSQNMNAYGLRQVWIWTHRSWLPLRTTNADAGGGFYSHHSGYVPFAWSRRPVESVGLGQVIRVPPRPSR